MTKFLIYLDTFRLMLIKKFAADDGTFRSKSLGMLVMVKEKAYPLIKLLLLVVTELTLLLELKVKSSYNVNFYSLLVENERSHN